MKLPNTIRKNPWWIAGAIGLLVVLWMVSGGNEAPAPADDAAAESEMKKTDVRVRHQQAENVDRFVSVYGRTEPARLVTLKAETEGRVATTHTDRGAYVKRGADLVTLLIRDREAQLARARSEMKAAQLTYEAEEKLKHESFASETRLAQAQAQYEAAKAELKRVEVDMANTRIRAPFNGALQERMVEEGDYVKVGEPIATFVEIDKLIISGSVSETERANLEIGSKATAKLVTGQEATGLVRYIAPVADEATRTFAIEVEVPNKNHSLPAGVTAELKLPAGQVLAHKVSPAILTLDANGEIGIKTVADDNSVQFTKVDIVKSSGEGVWIAGLPAESDIIIVGQGFVRPGETIDPVYDAEAVGTPAVAKAAAANGDAQ